VQAAVQAAVRAAVRAAGRAAGARELEGPEELEELEEQQAVLR
jgi:hypothetical protein